MHRKPYAPPRLTRHGGAVKMTRGRFGWLNELINFRFEL